VPSTHLRAGVEQAINALGSGFLAHLANAKLKEILRSGGLSGQDYYRQLLRLVYRLLFLFVAEDRDLLYDPEATPEARERYIRYYSTTRLRHLAAGHRGTKHMDLYRGLRVVMEKLGSDEGCSPLALPALGSFLWSEIAIPDLAYCDISNRDFLEAVRALAFALDNKVSRSVDYKNLGSEELGSIYEFLLELHPELNVDAATFNLTTAGGHERKMTGSYYTPTSLIQCLLDSALDPVLAEAARQLNAEEAILALKVCDPACGSGHFLIAAAHRMARRLAAIRTGDGEPSPEATRTALRDVISRCIYGVDVNPMAVELCKVNLWIEALEPGKPLTFLDHHIQCGNSLLGTTPALLAQGIPDETFKPIEGDDKAVVSALRQRNRTEREGQMTFAAIAEAPIPYSSLADSLASLDIIDDTSIAGVHDKEERYARLASSLEYRQARFAADAWCSAFVWKKTKDAPEPVTHDLFCRLLTEPKQVPNATRAEIVRLAKQNNLFHWHLAFPDVFRVPEDSEESENELAGWNGGFDVVLGNPPWERIKIQEKEWFAVRAPEIAEARNAAQRRKMIQELRAENPELFAAFLEEKRQADGESRLIRDAGRYPLCGRGDINTYAIFAELNHLLLNTTGRVGCIVPSGIATDDTTKFFFQALIESGSLVSLYSFENEEFLFPSVHHAMKFCLLTLSGARRPQNQADFVFFARQASYLYDQDRHFTLTTAELALFNPNTRTCPVFRSMRDAELTRMIHRHIPILIQENLAEGNPWGIQFLRMFDIAGDSPLFRTYQPLEAEGYKLIGNIFQEDDQAYLPLYEAKMLHHFDHRFGTYLGQTEAQANQGKLPELDAAQHADPHQVVLPRYWVPHDEVLLATANVPKGLGQAYRAQNTQMLAQIVMLWLAGYHLNRGNEEMGNAILLRHGSGVSDTMAHALGQWLSVRAMEQAFPLTADDLAFIQSQPLEETSFLRVAHYLLETRTPRWFLGWRDVCRNTDQRTVIASLLPRAGVGDKFLLMLSSQPPPLIATLLGCLNSFIFDYSARQKVSGTSLKYFTMKQLPVLPPSAYLHPAPWSSGDLLQNWLSCRILELTYTAWDMEPFAKDCGYSGPPFRWDEERRFLLRCELDAAYFHLYGIARDDMDYIMETFSIVKRNDIKQYGDFHTKRMILDIYDRMQQAMDTGEPYQTLLDPPPADPRVVHPPRTED